MTTAPTRRRTDTRYRGVVYALDVLDHHTSQIVPNDYVGKTRQRGRARELQHRDTQPFSDRIVGDARVLWEGMCTEDELDEMERRFIQDPPAGMSRPRLNYQLNEDNPERIPKWRQVEQRHERDDRAGRPRWVPPELRERTSLLEWDTPDRPAARPQSLPRKPWRPWQRQLCGATAWWLILFTAGWMLLAHFRLVSGWQDQAVTALLTPLPGIGWAWRWTVLGFPMSGRAWRRRAAARRRRR